jgi:arginine decarboxylase
MSGTRSPLIDEINRLADTTHRWCTPSVVSEQHRVEDVYASDLSISVNALGSPLDDSGRFGEITRFAASAHGADRSLAGANGATGMNGIVARALALSGERPVALVARNVHHSVLNTLKLNHVEFDFLPVPAFAANFEAVMPPSIDDVRQGLQQHPEATAVIYTSPTYEGCCADTKKIAALLRARAPHVLLIVDEAWGAHLAFSRLLPRPAIQSGADIVVQSTHKLGGALQPGALLLWNEQRVDSDLIMDAYRTVVSTSQSHAILGSVDAATRVLSSRGEELLDGVIGRASRLRVALASIPHLRLLGRAEIDVLGHADAKLDPCRVVLDVGAFATTGYALARHLEHAGIVVERAGLRSVVLLSTFQLDDTAVQTTAHSIMEFLAGSGHAEQRVKIENPFVLSPRRRVAAHLVARHLRTALEMSFDDAAGYVAAEPVELYPPGISVIIEGYEVSAQDVAYLKRARLAGARVVARDASLQTLRVLPLAAVRTVMFDESGRR